MTIISQNAVKNGLFVISGRNSGEIESEFYYILCKTNPICQRVKLMQSVYLQRIMKKYADRGYEKTKPKQTQF